MLRTARLPVRSFLKRRAGIGRRTGRCAVRAVLIAAVAFTPLHAEELRPYTIFGDAIAQSLTGAPGDPARGRMIVLSRQSGLCTLCHNGPFPDPRTQGNLAPDLAGVGARLTEGQLRLRMVDGAKVNPATLMPSYYRKDGLARVAAKVQDQPILNAQEIEDVVAYLATLGK